MKKYEKGSYPYYNAKKRQDLLWTAVLWALVAAMFISGVIATGDRMNWMTVFAMLGVLPAARATSSAVTRCVYKTIDPALYEQVKPYEEQVDLLYNMVFTAKEKTTPVAVVAVHGNTICGYTTSDKADPAFLEKHIRTILRGHRLKGQTIKIHKSEAAFMNWLRNAAETPAEPSEEAQVLKDLLVQISL